jgi:NSS family neurotransmitter:Na+ symporter
LLTAVFVGWVWRVDQAIDEVETHGASFPAKRVWSVLIRYVCPVAISVIIVYTIVSL